MADRNGCLDPQAGASIAAPILLPILGLVIMLVGAVLVAAQESAVVPAPGIKVPNAERQKLVTAVGVLHDAIMQVPDSPARVDVEILHRAVKDTITHDLFYGKNDVQASHDLLKLARERLAKLDTHSWDQKPGRLVLGYRSELDDSAQPYGLFVPASWTPDSTRQWRLDIWLHGRNDKRTELRFIRNLLSKSPPFRPANTLVLNPYGRFCNAYKFAGEVDVFEALADVKRRFNIDEDRISVRGFSMGGAAVWHLATHHADQWFAAQPGAGFAETARYSKRLAVEFPSAFGSIPEPMPHERTLYHLYDATDYAQNLLHCPTIAYDGERDFKSKKLGAELMKAEMAKYGLTLPILLGPNTKHRHHSETNKEINRRMDELAEKGREKNPSEIRFTTWTLRYPQMHWIRLTGLEKHWHRATVQASVTAPSSLDIVTTNVTRFEIDLQGVPVSANDWTVTINGASQSQKTAGSKFYCEKVGNTWRIRNEPKQAVGLRKVPSLQGPIDDAFMSRFILVRPSRPGHSKDFDDWVDGELQDAISQWHRQFRGEPIVKADTAIDATDIANANLIVWGDPKSNAVLNRIIDQLPIEWTASAFTLNGKAYASDKYAPIMIYPNPLNPQRYVVINGFVTYSEFGKGTNSLQVPKLPDFAAINRNVHRSQRIPAGVAGAGFFNEKWQYGTALTPH